MIDNTNKGKAAPTQSASHSNGRASRRFSLSGQMARKLLRGVSALASEPCSTATLTTKLSQLVDELVPHDSLRLLVPEDRSVRSGQWVGADGQPVSDRLTGLARQAVESGNATALEASGRQTAALASPLLHAGQGVAMLVVERARPARYTKSEVALASHVAARLYPALQEHDGPVNPSAHPPLFGRETEVNRVLAEIGRILTASLNIGDVYQSFGEQVARLVDFDRITLCYVDPGANLVTRAFVHGAEVPGITEGRTKPYTNSTEQAVIEARHAIVSSASDPELAHRGDGAIAWRESGLKSLVSAPLFARGVAVGTIGLSSFKAEAFTQEDADLLDRVANQIAGTVANARLHSRMSREAAEREGIARIGRVVGESLDLTTVCERLAEEVRKLVPYDRMVVTQIDREKDEIFGFYASGMGVPGRYGHIPTPLNGTLTERAVSSNAPVRADHSDENDLLKRYPRLDAAVDAGFKSFLVVPLRVESEAVGTINLSSQVPGAFSPSHERLLVELAAQVAPAVRNAELHQQIQEASEERLALAEIGRILGSAHDFSDIYEAIVEQIGRLLPADRVAITVQEDGDTGRVVLAAGTKPEFRPAGTSFPVPGTVSGWVFEHGRTIITGLDAGKAVLKEIPRLHEETDAGFRSILSTPLVEAGEIVGALHFRTEDAHVYQPRHAQVAEHIATQIAGSVANLGLREALEREISVSNALSEISRTVNASPDIHNVSGEVCERIAELTGAERVSISLIDLEQSETVHSLVWGREVEDRAEGWRSPLRGSITGWLSDSRATLLVNDDNFDAWAKQFPQLRSQDVVSGLHSMVSAPLLVSDIVRGALHLRSSAHNAFGEREAVLAERIAAQVAGAIVNSEHAVEARRTAEERLILTRIGQVASSSLDFGTVFPDLAQRLSELLPAERIVLADYDQKRELFTDRYVWGVQVEDDVPGKTYQLRDSVAGETFEARAPMAWNRAELEALASRNNVKTERQERRLKQGLASALVIPIIWQDRVYGVLSLRSSRDNAYNNRELALARQAGAQIAGAVVVSALYAETTRVAEDRLALGEIGRIASSSLDVGKVFDQISEKITALVPADRIVISTYDEDTRTFTDRFVWGLEVPGSEPGQTFTPGESLSFQEEDKREPTVRTKADLERFIGKVPGVEERFKAGLNSALRVPLIWQDRVFGELNIRSRLEDPYGAHEMELAREIGAQIVGAVAVSTLYEEAHRTSSERLALSEIGQIVSSSLDFNDSYDALVEQLQRLLQFDRIVLSIYDPSSESFEDRFVWGADIPTNQLGARHKLERSLSRDAFKERRSAAWSRAELEREAERSPGVAEGLRQGFVSALSAPLIWQNRVFGMMNLRSKQENAYGPRDLEIAEQTAAQISGGFASAFQYERASQEAELRKSLAAMSLAAGSDHRLESIFPAIERELEKIISFDRIAITLVDADSEKLRIVYTRGVPVPGFEEGSLIDLPAGHGGWLWQATILPNDPVKRGEMERLGLHSWIQVPLGNPSSGPIGYLSLRKSSQDFYDESHKDILEQVSTYITPGIQNALAQQREAELAAQRDRASQLEQQARELERVNQAKSEFFSSVSHELRTPLTSVVAFADIIARNREGTLSDRDLKHVEIIRRNATHLKVLINDLLDVSQVEAGRIELALQPVDLGHLLRDAADSISPTLDSKNQELSISIPRKKIRVEADPDRVNQVISNLLANAHKFAPADSRIELKLESKGNSAVFSVTDHGPGIPHESRAQLFTPFFRADDPAVRDVEGTGLGLAISKRLVDLHHGTIEALDTPGGGATLVVTLPLANTQT